MRYITEMELRTEFGDRLPQKYTLPNGARLTPLARQFLIDRGLYTPDAPVYCGYSGSTLAGAGEKPEDMTHLRAGELVRKDHPRIELRGKLDTLEAEILQFAASPACAADACLQKQLADALVLVRRILAADCKEAPLGEWTLDGMDEDQIHEASHNPKRYTGTGHMAPDVRMGAVALGLNLLRAKSREAEVCAVAAFANEKRDTGDLVLALNRLSSYFYVLQLKATAKEFGRSSFI